MLLVVWCCCCCCCCQCGAVGGDGVIVGGVALLIWDGDGVLLFLVVWFMWCGGGGVVSVMSLVWCGGVDVTVIGCYQRGVSGYSVAEVLLVFRLKKLFSWSTDWIGHRQIKQFNHIFIYFYWFHFLVFNRVDLFIAHVIRRLIRNWQHWFIIFIEMPPYYHSHKALAFTPLT